jgi:hypothetical protein
MHHFPAYFRILCGINIHDINTGGSKIENGNKNKYPKWYLGHGPNFADAKIVAILTNVTIKAVSF